MVWIDSLLRHLQDLSGLRTSCALPSMPCWLLRRFCSLDLNVLNHLVEGH